MNEAERRRSSRLVVPFVADEELAVIHHGNRDVPAKLVDFSTGGALLCVIDLVINAEWDANLEDLCDLSMYHERSVFQVKAKVVRTLGKFVAFEFVEQAPEVAKKIQDKMNRMTALCLEAERPTGRRAKAAGAH